ncbi:MAG: hypothetical protein JSS64_01730 [Bacteroidetes bacterium]|nr:hypothetical protein [Bacteroidota bacterium]
MRLENFKVSDMNKLSGENMTYIVGGNCATRTGESTGKDGTCYSNDYTTKNNVDYKVEGGGDWSEERLRREEQC